MNKRRITFYATSALLTFIVGVAIFGIAYIFHRPSPEAMDTEITRLNQLVEREIPNGSSVAQVETFLLRFNSRNFRRSEYVHHAEVFRWDSDFDQLQFDNKKQILKGYIGAIILNVEDEPLMLTEWSIQMTFYFDQQDHLAAHTIKWIGTGL